MNVKTVAMAVIALVVCCVIMVGATFALFTDNVVVNNHLSAGTLKVGLDRVSYKECSLNEKGVLEEGTENKDRIDLKEDANEIFNIEKAVPMCWYQATLEVSNLGSIAFDYGVKILWTPNDNKEDNDEIFASQIKITVTSNKINNEAKSVSFLLADASKTENTIPLGFILAGSPAETFTVRAEFLNQDGNNDAMLANLTFDVQVEAVQRVSE